jgi:HEAT repeat protein
MLRAFLLAGLFATVSTTLAAAADNQAFDEAADLYKRGRVDEALVKFREVLASNPSNEDALAMWDRASHDVFLPMLVREGEASTIARRFAELAKVSRKERSANPDAIKALVQQALNGDYRTQRDATNKLVADHGSYAVEYLYEYVGDREHVDQRVNAIMVLNQLGSDAVLPLIQVLKSDNELLRANTATVLGGIGDVRAAPSLAALLGGDQSEMVRAQARQALNRLNVGSTNAPELYRRQALSYFVGDPSITRPFVTQRLVWSWTDNKLAKKEVAPSLFPFEMARQNMFEALRLEPAQRSNQAGYAVACAAEKAEIQSEKESGVTDLGVDADALIAHIDTALGLSGENALEDALTITLDAENPEASAVLIQELGRMKASGPVLQRALESRDKLIRYPAALALAHGGHGSPMVVQVLAEALGETAVHNVLVIDDQDETRNAMLSALNQKGYNVLWASSGALGYGRAVSFPPKDVIVVRGDLRDVTLDGIVRAVKENPRTQNTAIIVVASKERLEEAKKNYEGKVAGLIESGSPATAFLPMIESAMPPLNPARTSAMTVSAQAAEALAHMDAQSLGPAVDGLVAALDGRPNEVRQPALVALAAVGPPAAGKPAATILADEASPKELRLAAAGTLASVLRNGAGDPGPDVTGPLTAALKTDDVELRHAVADAIGSAQFLTPTQRAELILAHPVP